MKNLLIFLLFSLPAVAKETAKMASGATAAEAFLATLDETQKPKAALPFKDDERENFHFTPQNKRAGLPFKEMTEAQRESAMKLLDTAVSEKGKLKVTQIMTLESLLAEIEKNPTYRDPGKYGVCIFGTPGDKDGWGWRFEGHHVSLSLTFIGGKVVSATPSFLGSNPGEVREGRLKGMRVLAAEEDLARTLVNTLLADGKKSVVYSEKPPSEIISAENRTVTAMEPVGITAEEMTESQREALMSLVSEYTGRYRSDIAEADLAKIKEAGIGKIQFGWAGGTQPGQAYYYRIQGPTFLMEAANIQNNANHVHAAWRDFGGDFGRDVLREHYTKDH